MEACARDCAMSYGASRQSKPIESLRRRNTACCGSVNRALAREAVGEEEVSRRDMRRLMLGSDARPGLRLNHRSQLVRHLRDLALGHLREEGQGDRARGDVLAHRKFTNAVAEALAVERHQVDGREVRLAGDALRAEGSDYLVALDRARQLDDEHEPTAARPSRVRARELEPFDRRKRLPI